MELQDLDKEIERHKALLDYYHKKMKDKVEHLVSVSKSLTDNHRCVDIDFDAGIQATFQKRNHAVSLVSAADDVMKDTVGDFFSEISKIKELVAQRNAVFDAEDKQRSDSIKVDRLELMTGI